MKLTHAIPKAHRILSRLQPHCERIEIAGSVRRQKEEVKDIEIVCIPKSSPGLFGDAAAHAPEFVEALRPMHHLLIKGQPATGRYLQYWISKEEEFKLDIFMATPNTWGWIYLLRTGPAKFNMAMLEELRKRNITSDKGLLWRDGYPLQVPEEQDVFEAAGMNYIEPRWRLEVKRR